MATFPERKISILTPKCCPLSSLSAAKLLFFAASSRTRNVPGLAEAAAACRRLAHRDQPTLSCPSCPSLLLYPLIQQCQSVCGWSKCAHLDLFLCFCCMARSRLAGGELRFKGGARKDYQRGVPLCEIFMCPLHWLVALVQNCLRRRVRWATYPTKRTRCKNLCRHKQ